MEIKYNHNYISIHEAKVWIQHKAIQKQHYNMKKNGINCMIWLKIKNRNVNGKGQAKQRRVYDEG